MKQECEPVKSQVNQYCRQRSVDAKIVWKSTLVSSRNIREPARPNLNQQRKIGGSTRSRSLELLKSWLELWSDFECDGKFGDLC